MKDIGLAVIGCGTIGRIRAELARDYPGVKWLGLCDIRKDVAEKLAADCNADFYTTDFNELLNRNEVTAVIIATEENAHVEPTLKAIEMGHALFIEKPLATNPQDSRRIIDEIESNNIDAVLGYTNRFRRRFLAVKERLTLGKLDMFIPL